MVCAYEKGGRLGDDGEVGGVILFVVALMEVLLGGGGEMCIGCLGIFQVHWLSAITGMG